MGDCSPSNPKSAHLVACGDTEAGEDQCNQFPEWSAQQPASRGRALLSNLSGDQEGIQEVELVINMCRLNLMLEDRPCKIQESGHSGKDGREELVDDKIRFWLRAIITSAWQRRPRDGYPSRSRAKAGIKGDGQALEIEESAGLLTTSCWLQTQKSW